MYGKYTLFYESPKNWGYLHPCANSVYQTSPRVGGGGGGGGEGPGNEAMSSLASVHSLLLLSSY